MTHDQVETAWRDKAHKIIAVECFREWKRLNHNRKWHVPYSTTVLADELVDCLNTNNEEKAKALFFSYDGLQAYKQCLTVTSSGLMLEQL